MDPLAAFSRNVKAARAAAGMTQQEVAEAASLEYAQYRKIENGQTNATIRTVVRIAAALDLADPAPLFSEVAASAPRRRR